MPFASMSKVTSTCGTPRGAAGIPSRWNRPSVRLSPAISRSPWRTWISTLGWPSEAVVKTSLLRMGIVVFRSISFVITPPSVSIPNDSGVTSRRSRSFTVPPSTPACTAAPAATTSSGLTPWCGSLPKNDFTISTTFGMRVEPPTRTTSSIFPTETPASRTAISHGFMVRSRISWTICSNFARDSFSCRCFGPDASAVMNGRLISVSITEESSIFAFSAPSFSRWRTVRSFDRSIPWSFLNSAMIHSISRWSMLSPPRCVSPFVDFTSTTLSPTSRMEMSKVPPPKSKTAISSFFFRSRP